MFEILTKHELNNIISFEQLGAGLSKMDPDFLEWFGRIRFLTYKKNCVFMFFQSC